MEAAGTAPRTRRGTLATALLSLRAAATSLFARVGFERTLVAARAPAAAAVMAPIPPTADSTGGSPAFIPSTPAPTPAAYLAVLPSNRRMALFSAVFELGAGLRNVCPMSP